MVWFSKVKNINWTAHAAFSPTVTGVAFLKSGGMTHLKTTTVANKVFPPGLVIWIRELWKNKINRKIRSNSLSSGSTLKLPVKPSTLQGASPTHWTGIQVILWAKERISPAGVNPLFIKKKILLLHLVTTFHTMHMCRMHPPEPFCPPH